MRSTKTTQNGTKSHKNNTRILLQITRDGSRAPLKNPTSGKPFPSEKGGIKEALENKVAAGKGKRKNRNTGEGNIYRAWGMEQGWKHRNDFSEDCTHDTLKIEKEITFHV